MPGTVNIHAAKTQLSRLIELAQAGEETIIARAGKPVARLAPLIDKGGKLATAKKRPLGILSHLSPVAPDYDAPLPVGMLAAFDGD
jgi:antitoxin (DNA-binding transcriptional repressor) of toxin-antitoxin stability system